MARIPALSLGTLIVALAVSGLAAAGAEPLPAPAPAAAADADLVAQSAAQASTPTSPAGPPTLRFLHAHRGFLLTRLSAHGGPGAPDPRLKSWLDERMVAAVAGLGAAEDAMPRGTLGGAAEWPEIDALDATLDSLVARMTGIEARLAGIRHDFAFNQATELLVALAAEPDAADDLESLALRWDRQEVAAADLPAAERSALAAGGYRPLHRAFCRPAAQEIAIDLALAGGATRTGSATLSPAPNRLTVLVFTIGAQGVRTQAWTL